MSSKFPALWVLCLVSCALCLIPGHSLIVCAQETTRVSVTEMSSDGKFVITSTKAASDGVVQEEEYDIIISDDIIYIDDLDLEDEAAETDDIDGGKAPGEGFPPEVRGMMEKDGISPKDLGDPEIRKKLAKKVEQSASAEGEGNPQERRRPRGRRGGGGGGLDRYTSVIVKNNLFLRLGSGGEKKGVSYALTAVISSTSEESDNNSRAIIEEKGGGRSYYVNEGDTFAGGIEVIDIEDEKVKLDKSGEEMTLALGEGTSGGGGGGRRGGGRRGGGGRPSGGGGSSSSGGDSKPGGGSSQSDGDFNPDDLPPVARRMLEQRGISMEQLRNNPDLRINLRREFEQRSRGGGTPQRPRGGSRRRR